MNLFNVQDEFKKNPELNEEDLNHLREWISKQPHLPVVTGKYTDLNFEVPQKYEAQYYLPISCNLYYNIINVQ